MLSEHQQMVIERLTKGEELRAVVTWSSSGHRIGLGVHRFVKDKRPVKLDTLWILIDQGLARRTNYGPYDKIELTDEDTRQDHQATRRAESAPRA